MSLSDRLHYGLIGGFLGALIAMAIMFWTSFEHTSLLFKIMIPAGAVGGFLFGKGFADILSDIYDRIWH